MEGYNRGLGRAQLSRTHKIPALSRSFDIGIKRVLSSSSLGLRYKIPQSRFWGPFKRKSESDTFESKEDLVGNFGRLIDSKQVSDLNTVLRPYPL